VTPIRIEQVTKRFGQTMALDRVSLEIAAGELFFLLGPSGCGKTTLLRAIAGFCPPDGGTIHFGDADVTTLSPQRRDTGMVFQNYALWPHMSVERNVEFGLSVRRIPRGERRKRVAEVLETVRLKGQYARRKPNQLSGGQQQRVALARAIVVRPRCLLLDEPLSNLDAKLRVEMRGEIRRICKESRITAVYVTHDQEEALSVADRMAVLFDGRLAQVGAPRELYRAPHTRDVADFLGESNFIEARPAGAEKGVTRFETAVGEISAETAAPPRSERVWLSIRPEAFTPAASTSTAQAGQSRITGTVTGRTYLGNSVEYRLRCAADYELRVRLADRRREHAEWQAGDQVTVAVSSQDVVALQDAATAD
jgi:iron(III) transport system ATP-binding protein